MIKPQAIDAGVKIALETVFLYDEKGIWLWILKILIISLLVMVHY
jgi:hypothetical protein